MVGIEQYFRNLFLSHQILVDYLNREKGPSIPNDQSDIFIDSLPGFSDGFSKHLPLILIKCIECRDSFFYDDEPHAYDVVLNIRIGARTYEELSVIGELLTNQMLEESFILTDSDSFNDSVENMRGLSITLRNNVFMGLHRN